MFMILALIATANVAAPVDPSEEAELLKKHLDQQEVEAVQEIVIDDSVVDEFGFDLEEEES